MHPLVSIQIPTFNQQIYIGDAIESCLKQTYNNIEIIISDDCSPNFNIIEILENYNSNPKIRINRNVENKGRVKNYHDTLYNLVNGKYFVNLDGDDFLIDNNYINYGVELLEKFKDRNTVLFHANQDIKHIKSIIEHYTEIDEFSIILKGTDYFESFHLVNRFTHASCIFKTDIAKKIGFYTIDAVSSDFNSAMRILLEGSVILSSKKVSYWRVHEQNASSEVNKQSIKIEIESNKNIINAAKNKIPKNKLKIAQRGIYKGFFLKNLTLFEAKNEYKNAFMFIIRYSKLEWDYFKVWILFVKSSIKKIFS